ncbi:MAG: HEPN domain-containing protein [Deltaproteobacteria bacterium]|nr:HEPN domain-containing protein [Deltaproteobacteria bacterium]
MTDAEQLVEYRIEQAEESLESAEVLLENGMSPRSVTNRAYYAAFYAVLALHKLFDKRLEFDYKDRANPTEASAVENIRIAKEFVARIKALIAEP